MTVVFLRFLKGGVLLRFLEGRDFDGRRFVGKVWATRVGLRACLYSSLRFLDCFGVSGELLTKRVPRRVTGQSLGCSSPDPSVFRGQKKNSAARVRRD